MKILKNNWFKFLNYLLPNETNLVENKHQIQLLLTYSNYQKLFG